MTLDTNTPPGPSRGRARRWLANAAWVLTGCVLTVVLIAGPLRIHPLDAWLQSVLDRWHTRDASAKAEGASRERRIAFYRNPMNPSITSPVPAKDEMGMDYVPVYEDELGPEAKKGERKVLFYRNPMNPEITSPVPAKDEMGMDYVPVYEDEAEQAEGQGATVTIDPAVVQNMNVLVQKVERRDLHREIRTVGYLDYDQQKMVTSLCARASPSSASTRPSWSRRSRISSRQSRTRNA
jgi:hypothetical protein